MKKCRRHQYNSNAQKIAITIEKIEIDRMAFRVVCTFPNRQIRRLFMFVKTVIDILAANEKI
jgi:hypothetical protein